MLSGPPTLLAGAALATAAATRCAAARLSLLHLLNLLRVHFVQLLRLLLMLLLHLLRPFGGCLLLRQLLMFLILRLLEFLPLLVLRGDQLILLLLVFLVHLRVPRFGRGRTLHGRQILRMGREVRTGCCGHRWRAVVSRIPLLRVVMGSPRVLGLSGYSLNMSAFGSGLLLRRGARIDPAGATVVADAVRRFVHLRVVNG